MIEQPEEKEPLTEDAPTISPVRRDSVLEPFRDQGPTFVLRQWLNVLFIVGAIVGIILVYTHSRDLGIYVFIGAGVLKFIELSLRLLKL